jgi:hypothetical protein
VGFISTIKSESTPSAALLLPAGGKNGSEKSSDPTGVDNRLGDGSAMNGSRLNTSTSKGSVFRAGFELGAGLLLLLL